MKDSAALVPTILITGANGQLGKEVQKVSALYSSYQFLFTSKENLPIDNFGLAEHYFNNNKIDYCINCAAYTAVDKAETQPEKAYQINAEAVGNLAKICAKHHAKLIHISTDYVFDGTSSKAYKEDDAVAPQNVYGASKLKGEEFAISNNSSTLIIRTSWVYSSFGNNFVKTMVRLLNEKESINVVNDQYGCPTYAANLAQVISRIIDQSTNKWLPGIFNYSDYGVTTWYEFASEIKRIIKSNCIINPVASSEYRTLAARPKFSVLDTEKIHKTFNVIIPGWKDSLQKCISELTS